jgi:OOP family OmpA-OmpF porin
MFRKMLMAATALVGLSSMAQAQEIPAYQGFYLGATGGAEWLLGSATLPNGQTVTTSTGWSAGARAGYDFVGPRVELEGRYYQATINTSVPASAINGKLGTAMAMANVLYDFWATSAFSPYVGAGAGIAFVDGNSSLGNTEFAYQAILGLGYNIDSHWKVSLEGRYIGTTNPSVTVAGTNFSYPNNNVQALLGISYKFGGPDVAAPPPAPAAPSAPSYMVFFDWDRSDLSAQAISTIHQVSAAYKQKGSARVTATGHTDKSGPDDYNMALSLRRANAVKDALVRDGVPATAIAVVGRGETQPLVPTADGVREPQNRRVEIVLQ